MENLSVLSGLFHLSRPFLNALDAEQAHLATIRALSCLPLRHQGKNPYPRLSQNLFGLDFPNPVGLAPGFDKNAEVPHAMLGFGFGFVEVGTVTPRPQTGNAKPRLFRLSEDRAVINRMGFNNQGHDAVLQRLSQRHPGGIIGVNIGANKDATDRISDYVRGIEVFSDVANYITINISSPNTPGLRGLQSPAELQQLLDRLNSARAKKKTQVPMLLKIAPDLGDEELRDIAICCGGGAVDGVIISNTTLSRPSLTSKHAHETGGLSGRPLRSLATRQLAKFFVLTKGQIPLVGAGGVEDAASALEKIRAGASLVQLYSALVYQGPGLIADILKGMRQNVGAGQLATLRGSQAERLSQT